MTRVQTKKHKWFRSVTFRFFAALILCMSLTLSGCFDQSEGEPYYGRVTTPQTQEFRWSDGGLPQTFDPAMAAAPPDTDAVRALFEGLTDYDPLTLAPVPGVAVRWESSQDGREWTFFLRPDARWSNGDMVTAKDFVRSWQRSISFGTRAPHARLFDNIVGTRQTIATTPASELAAASQQQSRSGAKKSVGNRGAKEDAKVVEPATVFGAEAINDSTLRVRLERPDRDFASLVAHPIFRPVHDARNDYAATAIAQPVVSNGPFKLTQVASDGVVLERAVNYWDAKTVSLSRVRFVATNNAEEALQKYRTGEVDAVTNAGFEPLALKLLAPYKDFRRATFGALTYYKFNAEHAPFSDVRVREALAIAIDRERISEDEMDGASEPANAFLPSPIAADGSAVSNANSSVSHDIARAQRLLAEAGFQNGIGFPVVKLLVNRNDQQRLIALSIANMWRKSLGVETEIVVKSWEEYEAAIQTGDYDVVRKGMVMQTIDETANMRAMFDDGTEGNSNGGSAFGPGESNGLETTGAKEIQVEKKAGEGQTEAPVARKPILSQADALRELPAIPIYFASSYSLVRPYVTGFDSNLLDAPSLKRVRLDTAWREPQSRQSGWFRKIY